MRSVPLLSVFFMGASAVNLWAAPANDSFGSRAVLTLAGTAGSNVDASVEPGEPAPLTDLAATGTVWWSFTPANSGWYEINTAGSAIDTVMAVYQGNALNNLVRIAAADEDELTDSVSTSRVRFQATLGVAVAIQVGSYSDASRGNITLSVQAVSPLADRVNSLTPSPAAPFDVGPGNQIVTVTFSLEQSAALDSGTVFVSRPDGALLNQLNFTVADRISGTATTGTYQVTATLPRYAAPGNYPLWITASSVNAAVGIPDLQAGGWVWNSLPSTATPYLTVTNSGTVDGTAPGLTSAVFSQPTANVTSAGILVPLTLQITDNLSGLSSAVVSLEQPLAAGQSAVLTSATVTSANRVSGTALNGQYSVQFYVPQDSGAGIWNLRASLTDGLGNTASVASSATLTVNKTPWTAWVTARGLTGADALPSADPDHDGQTNLEEFAFHTDPLRSDLKPVDPFVPERVYLFHGAPPFQYLSSGELHLRYLRRRGANAGTATTEPQFGSALSDWSPAADLTVTPLSAEWEMVDARDTAPVNSVQRRFGRVTVTLP